MPNPHFDVQIISRGNGSSAVGAASYRSGTRMTSRQGGKSAIAAAAYRAGEPLYDEAQQKTYDYTRKEDVVHKEIILPEKAPGALKNRETLWNTIEQIEKRKDAQLARDGMASLPRELSLEQQIALVREFVREQFTSKGMIADIAIHDKQASDGDRQPHVHILLTMREITSEGFGKKNREWNHKDRLLEWRDAWEKHTNRHLEKAGREERVSLKSYKERGIDKTPQEYMGFEAWKLEQRGIKTEKGNRNRRARHFNKLWEKVKNLRFPDREEVPLEPVHAPGAKLTLQQVAKALENSGSGGNAGSGETAHGGRVPLLQERWQAAGEAAPVLPPRLRHQQRLRHTLSHMNIDPAVHRAARARWTAQRMQGNRQREMTRMATRMNNQEIAEKLRKEEERQYER